MTEMFEPRLTPQTLRAEPVHAGRSYRDLADTGTDKRDRAPFAEWGHAHIAPTDADNGEKVWMFPFTP